VWAPNLQRSHRCLLGEISGSHRGDYEDGRLKNCCIVHSGRSLLRFKDVCCLRQGDAKRCDAIVPTSTQRTEKNEEKLRGNIQNGAGSPMQRVDTATLHYGKPKMSFGTP
jgi:hypothetical protein